MLIKNGLVLRRDGTADRLDILVKGGTIAAIGHFDGDEEVLDATNRLVAPGLINTHCHSHENYFKGRWENLPLELWVLFSHPILAGPPQTPREIYVRTMLGCIEMLKSGCTAVVDFLYEIPEMTLGTVNSVMQAYRDSGMRALVVVGYADRIWYEAVPVALDVLTPELKAHIDAKPLASPEDNIALVDAVRAAWHGVDDRLTVGLAPSGPQRCSDRQLELSVAYAMQHDLRIHTHTLETKMQAYTGHRLYGQTIIQHLADLDFLSPRVSLNHAIWLTEQDIDLIAERGASVTHNLLSNLKLGSGISPVPEMLALNIPISLGTDGKGSNDSQDMYEVLKMTALLHKTQQPDFTTWIGAHETWRMATTGGARSIGMYGEIGEIGEGQRADLVLFDLDTTPFVPINVPLNHLVYCLPSRSVDTVLVEGRIVVRNGTLTCIDGPSLLREGRDLARGVIERSGRTFDLGHQLMPSVAEGYRRAVAVDVGVDRYIGWPPRPPAPAQD